MGTVARNADPHVGVQRGEGLVARLGAAVVVIGTTDAQTDPFASALLAVLDNHRAEGGATTDSFAWEVADLIAAHRRQAPAFGLALALADGYQILLHGKVRAVVSTRSGEIELTGGSASTWVDRIVGVALQQISITLTDGPVVVDPRSDLRAGLVGGGGLVLVAGESVAKEAIAPLLPTGPQYTVDRPSPPSVPPQPAAAPTPARDVHQQSTPAPASGPPQPGPGGRAAARASGIVEETAIVKTTSSALVADDGTRIPLDRHYVFGRDPSHDQSVLRGAASPIVVRDPDQVISRVQVHVGVVGDVVTLRDSGSSNGTYIAAPGAAEWDRLTDRPTPLPPGWSMRIGRRVYTYTVGRP